MSAGEVDPPGLVPAPASSTSEAGETSGVPSAFQEPLPANADRSRVRASFLVEAGRTLASSLDYEQTLQHVAKLLVPTLADWCIVHLLEASEKPQAAVVVHNDPEKIAWARSLEGRYPPDPDSSRGLYHVLRTGQPELHAEITDEMLAAGARSEEHLRILRELGPTSALIVPLQVRERILGVVSLIATESRIRFDAEDRELAELLAERMALAIDHAQLYRQTQEALEQLRSLHVTAERFAAIVSSSDDSIISKDLNGTILTWNESSARMYGYTAEEMIGQPITRLMPPDRVNEESEILERLRRGERVEHFESVRNTKDGRQIDVSVTISPVRDADGNVVGASKIARDISERKRLELELQARAEEVEAQREELEMQNEELNAQNEELERADAAKNAFVAMLAHELRNPLAPLRNAMFLLGPRIPEEPAAQRQRHTIERQLRSLSRLVDDLLEASRVSRGVIALRRDVLDVCEVAGTAADALSDYIEERGHTLSVLLPSGPVTVEGDPLRLEQVIINLLNNAAKFTEPGGHIELGIESMDGEARIRVRDNGVGIPAELLPRVFDLFAQGDQGLARTRGGLGIGLNVVRNLVDLHHGTVTASSGGAGLGTEVVVSLPLVKAGVVRHPLPDGEQAYPGVARAPIRRALVVDDGRDAADTMADLLREWGLEASVAYAGEAALELVEKEKPDLIFLDIGMPQMDGFEVARRIRRRPDARSFRLIALTGYGTPEDRRRALDAGFDEHLTKPVDPAELRRLIQTNAVS